MKKEPTKIDLEDGKILYRCPDCEWEVDEDCHTFSEACYYCPEECPTCGRGFCDQSC